MSRSWTASARTCSPSSLSGSARWICALAAPRPPAAKGYSPRYGARPLRRAVQKLIEDPAAEMILSGELQPQGTLLCDYNQEEHAICLTAKR